MKRSINAGSVRLDEDLMKKGWVIFTGGLDMAGNPLITFPALDQASSWTSDTLLRLLLYMTDIAELILKRKAMGFLADFQRGFSEEKMAMLIQALQSLESEKKGTVAILYVLKPKSRGKSHSLKKLLGIKQKKDQVTFASQFKSVLLKSITALHTQIEPSQLTREFGGTIAYDQHSWMYFYKKILPTVALSEETLERSVDIKDKTLLLKDYEIAGHSSRELRRHKKDIQQRYKELQGENHIKTSIQKCKQALHLLDEHSENDPLGHLHHLLIMEVTTNVRTMYHQLLQLQKELEQIWKDLNDLLDKEIAIKTKSEEAELMCMEISERFWPLLTQHPTVASCLSQAEMFRTHFTTTLYDPATQMMSTATQILQHLRIVKNESTDHAPQVKALVSRLTNTVRPFTHQLNSINQIYTSIHVFFFIFEKSLTWYKRSLSFIPNSLCNLAVETNPEEVSFLSAPPDWKYSVRMFLKKHPAPREDHVAGLDKNAPREIDIPSKTRGKKLANRLRILISIMQDTYLDVNCIKAIHAWKQDELTDEIPEFNETDQLGEDAHSKLLSPFKSQRPSRLRRRMCRSRSSHQNQQLKRSFRIGCDGKVRHVVHESSDNDGPGFSSESGSLGKGEGLVDSCHGEKNWRRHIKHQPLSKRIRSFRSTSSIQSSGNWSMKTDSAVDFIYKITSSKSLSSEKKLQFVSDILLVMEDDDNNCEEEIYEDYNTVNDTLFANRSHRRTPAETVSEMTGRLCKSLDNILGSEILPDQRSLSSNTGTKSLSNIRKTDSEVQLWKQIESRSASMKSVHIDDRGFSSKSDESADDIDDSAPIEVLARNKPMRQNIRRKRRNTTDNFDMSAIQKDPLFRNNSDMILATNPADIGSTKTGLTGGLEVKDEISSSLDLNPFLPGQCSGHNLKSDATIDSCLSSIDPKHHQSQFYIGESSPRGNGEYDV
ncbi:uncharacterized protein LOC134251753 [Saccostrea cucullata]|uniref:uncharacterized protein LOC134251753 n=1 Tax=Saccostrea cuccullata TaxID=36930 RepID=UPI002ED0A330